MFWIMVLSTRWVPSKPVLTKSLNRTAIIQPFEFCFCLAGLRVGHRTNWHCWSVEHGYLFLGREASCFQLLVGVLQAGTKTIDFLNSTNITCIALSIMSTCNTIISLASTPWMAFIFVVSYGRLVLTAVNWIRWGRPTAVRCHCQAHSCSGAYSRWSKKHLRWP